MGRAGRQYSKTTAAEKRAHQAIAGPHYAARRAAEEPRFREGDTVRNVKAGFVGRITGVVHGLYQIEGQDKLFPASVLEAAH